MSVKIKPNKKNLFCKVYGYIYDSLEDYCEVNDYSKREVVERALIQYLYKFNNNRS